MTVKAICLSLVTSMMLISSCEDDPVKYKDPQLSGYVDRFIEQAAAHGQNISADDWAVEFGSVQENFCGMADNYKVRISQKCWDAMPESGREAIIFHELGHALLKRSHKEVQLPNGEPASIMHNDPTTLYNAYTPIKRLYYIEELFIESTVAPDWSLAKTNATTVFEDAIQQTNEWQFILSASSNHSQAINGSVFSSPSSSLQINSLGTGSGYSFWTYSITPETIAEGTPVDVKVKIRTDGVSGEGASMTIRGDVNGDPLPAFVYSTQGKSLIAGTSDKFVEYTLKIPYFPNRLDKLNFYLILLNNSVGTVYFDDLEMVKYN